MSNRWRQSDGARGDDYDRGYEAAERAGQNVHGEAGFIMTLQPRSVLDGGCGTGRVGRELARRGVEVVGVDADPAMLVTARRKAPDVEWVEADLAELDLRAPAGEMRHFDLVVLAGNVMIFLDPGTEPAVMRSMARHLRPSGLLVSGFSLGRGLDADELDDLARRAGFELAGRWSTWQRDPWRPEGDYCLSVHRLVAGST